MVSTNENYQMWKLVMDELRNKISDELDLAATMTNEYAECISSMRPSNPIPNHLPMPNHSMIEIRKQYAKLAQLQTLLEKAQQACVSDDNCLVWKLSNGI